MRKGTEQCAFIISDEEAKTYLSLGDAAFVYAQKLARDNEINNSITECQLLDCGGFYRLQVTY